MLGSTGAFIYRSPFMWLAHIKRYSTLGFWWILNSPYRPKKGWTLLYDRYKYYQAKIFFYNRPMKNFRFKVRQTNFPFHIMSLILTKLHPKEIVFCKSFLLSKISKVVYRSQIFASFALWRALWVSVLAAFFISDNVFRIITLQPKKWVERTHSCLVW